MSDEARRSLVEISINGASVTDDLQPYLLSCTYTDNEEDEADDLQIQLQDREAVWLTAWLDEIISAAAAADLTIDAVFYRNFWSSGGADVLPCGQFQLDSVAESGPPNVVKLRATSLPFSNSARQTKKWRAWESYNLSGIAGEIAGNAGLSLLFESGNDPYYERVEQYDRSDIVFLQLLCHNAGISLKITDGQMVLFEQTEYEAKEPVRTIRYGDGSYLSYSVSTGSADTQYGSCRVSYVDPETGKCIEGKATATEEDQKSDQCLELSFKVSDAGEAKELAEKNLRLHNKYERILTFKLPGDPVLVAGQTVGVEGFGGWSGKYIIKQAQHSVSPSGGYTTTIRLRRILEGY